MPISAVQQSFASNGGERIGLGVAHMQICGRKTWEHILGVWNSSFKNTKLAAKTVSAIVDRNWPMLSPVQM